MRAYEDMIRSTNSEHAPWYVVPADHKWFTQLVVGAAVIDAIQEMHPEFPTVDRAQRKELAAVRTALEGQGR
jgi:hypothetical protein